jgi:hypothetical protein
VFEPAPCRSYCSTTLLSLSQPFAHAMTSLNLITHESTISPNIVDANNPRKRQRTACDRCKSRKQKVGAIECTCFTSCHSYVLDSVIMHIHNAPTAQRLARTATNHQRGRIRVPHTPVLLKTRLLTSNNASSLWRSSKCVLSQHRSRTTCHPPSMSSTQ